MSATAYESWPAWLHGRDWSGDRKDAVLVVGETPTRWRITPEAGGRVKLSGRHRWLEPGGKALVPKGVVTPRTE